MSGRPRPSPMLALLRTPLRRLLGDRLIGLQVTGRRTGRVFGFPVMAAPASSTRVGEERLVVLVGRSATKTWWRNLRDATPVQVLRGGGWRPALATVLEADDPGRAAAEQAYRGRWPRVPVPPDDPLVLLVLGSGRTAQEVAPDQVNAEGEPESTKG